MTHPQNKLHNTGRTCFKPGKSGNPGGRPKGLAALVRESTKDGKELVALHLKILRGTLRIKRERFTSEGEIVPFEDVPSFRDRLQAAEWLAERGFGKVDSSVTVQNPDGSNLLAAHIIEAAVTVAAGLAKN